MRYAVILNDPCPDFAGEIRRISGVIERCGLDASDAQLIRISIGHALPQTAARYIAEHFSEISMFICPSGKLGDELAVHIAEYSGGSAVTEVMEIKPDEEALKQYVAEKLGKYMVPEIIETCVGVPILAVALRRVGVLKEKK